MLKATLNNIKIAAGVVKKGGIIVYPTDTVYGLGCDPFNVDAVKRIIRVKDKRDRALPILANSLNDVNRVAHLSTEARKISDSFWPGPLTLVLPKKKLLSDVVTSGLRSVGVRIPRHKVALELIKLSGGLLIGTSANKTGSPPPFTAGEASEQLKDEVEVILDGGETELRLSSTVIDMTGEKLRILRQGSVGLEDVLKILGGLDEDKSRGE